MKFTTLAIVGSLISYATAYVNPIEPWGETKWIPGSKVTIQWDDKNPDGPALSTNPIVDVFLMTGSDQVMVKLDTIASKVNANTQRNVTYTVPTVDPIGKSKSLLRFPFVCYIVKGCPSCSLFSRRSFICFAFDCISGGCLLLKLKMGVRLREPLFSFAYSTQPTTNQPRHLRHHTTHTKTTHQAKVIITTMDRRTGAIN